MLNPKPKNDLMIFTYKGHTAMFFLSCIYTCISYFL